ncbi:MAG: oligosaccharide flippase family protein [Acaryochloris sp. RU_4_1]|nr:oligosaccharide flippase family protein [Acaryochloris sp. RU_4_1]NJR55875.1 oligosaccharide flippase family protein [Acaryochloris sp. CRU_2_0]
MNILLKCSQKIIQTSFLRNVFTLITGTALSQFIPILLSPVLTRVYSPQAFGSLALYMSVSTILAILATGRYEQAIILPDDDNDSLNIVALCIGIATIFSFSILLGLFVFWQQIFLLAKHWNFDIFLKLLPITVLLLAIYQSLYYWFNRSKLYRAITLNRVFLATAVVIFQLALYKFPDAGLVVGYVLGQIIGVGYSIFQIFTDLRSKTIPIKISFISIKKQAERYIKFPRFLLIGHMMNAISGNMPIILFQGFYGSSFSGFYSLTFRVITLPMSLIGNAISDVFREVASRQYIAEGQCQKLFLKTFKSLLLMAIVPFAIFFLVSPNLFTLFFGAEWSKAGTYARLLSPMLFCQFITIPLCSMFIIAEKQELDLVWQVARMILSIGSIWIGYVLYRSDNTSVLLFSLSFCVLYLVSGVMSYSFSCPNSRVKEAP